MVRSSLVRKVAIPPLTLLPLPPWQDLFACDRLTAIARQQVAAQQAEMDALRNAFALQQKATANLEKILGNMASQMTSTSEATQAALAAILARLETVATKPNPTTTTATTTTTTTTDQPSKDTRFRRRCQKGGPPINSWLNASPEFRKAGAAAWLASEARDFSPCTQCTESGALLGSPTHLCKWFPYAKPGDLRKAMQGARIRTSAVRDIRWISRQVVQLLVDADYVSAFTRIITSLDATIVKSFKAWVPRSEAADKDKLAAISSFAAKTTLEAATAEATKIRVQTPDFEHIHTGDSPKESLPVKKATDKEPAAPAVDPPSDMAAEVTPAIQDDGVTPTVTPIADVEMCL
ncbi:hypothetical protein BASA60_006234 [Batrachochytrium salamandrivorans]|nr:hypothetical protein BASA60_006234 [Batrachochytrium salamandrivorans]